MNGAKGDPGMDGAKGDVGPQGPHGAKGDSGISSDRTIFVFGTDQSLSKDHFMGQGTSSSDFSRNALIVPGNGMITFIHFSIREVVNNMNIVCTLWKQTDTGTGGIPAATSLFATIVDGRNMWIQYWISIYFQL